MKSSTCELIDTTLSTSPPNLRLRTEALRMPGAKDCCEDVGNNTERPSLSSCWNAAWTMLTCVIPLVFTVLIGLELKNHGYERFTAASNPTRGEPGTAASREDSTQPSTQEARRLAGCVWDPRAQKVCGWHVLVFVILPVSFIMHIHLPILPLLLDFSPIDADPLRRSNSQSLVTTWAP